jgi:hypothetical protein
MTIIEKYGMNFIVGEEKFFRRVEIEFMEIISRWEENLRNSPVHIFGWKRISGSYFYC